jgi:hypothetical protein
MRKGCHRSTPQSLLHPTPETVSASRGCGKPPKGFGLSVAFRAQIEQVPLMNLAALKRKTMKTPPRRALEVSAR